MGSIRPGLVACVMAGALWVSPSLAKKPLQVGDLPPDSLGTASVGGKVNLTDHHGKIVVITFWASWCTPCRNELSILAAIQKNATRDKLEVFAVNSRESHERYRAILKALKDVDLAFVSDESGYFGNEYGVKAIPHMIILGRDGRIAAIHEGYSEKELPDLIQEINEIGSRPLESPPGAAVAPDS
jgi:thiol-disulfide isomerase/thioredoxin